VTQHRLDSTLMTKREPKRPYHRLEKLTLHLKTLSVKSYFIRGAEVLGRLTKLRLKWNAQEKSGNARAETGAKRPLAEGQRLRRPAAPTRLRARAVSAPAKVGMSGAGSALWLSQKVTGQACVGMRNCSSKARTPEINAAKAAASGMDAGWPRPRSGLGSRQPGP